MKYKQGVFILMMLISGCTYNASNRKDVPAMIGNSDTTKIPDSLTTADTNSPGELIKTIAFQVKTADIKNCPDGYMHWIDIEHSNKDVKLLSYPDSIVITEPKIILTIDYPLRNAYKAVLQSKSGFTRLLLLKEICDAYHKIYIEEEATATVKTIPVEKRGNTLNRNETNGKYGIWGHDLSDLALDDILVYKTKKGELILVLDMES